MDAGCLALESGCAQLRVDMFPMRADTRGAGSGSGTPPVVGPSGCSRPGLCPQGCAPCSLLLTVRGSLSTPRPSQASTGEPQTTGWGSVCVSSPGLSFLTLSPRAGRAGSRGGSGAHTPGLCLAAGGGANGGSPREPGVSAPDGSHPSGRTDPEGGGAGGTQLREQSNLLIRALWGTALPMDQAVGIPRALALGALMQRIRLQSPGAGSARRPPRKEGP